MSKGIRARAWCFTINNYTEADGQCIYALAESARYICVGMEQGENGTPHYQGYVYFNDAKTFTSIKKKLPRAHIEVARGTPQQNNKYCTKDGNLLIEQGTIPQQGKRTDLCAKKDEIMNGKKVDDIILEDPEFYHQYGRTLHKIEDLRMRQVYRTEMTEGEWVYGTTGTGKSEYAFKDYDPKTHYIWKYEKNGWQDGYAQQPIVIIDEFRGQMTMNELLMMIDKHPNFFVQRRGREPLPFTSKKVIITSSLAPGEVYHNLCANDKLDQLYRRIILTKMEKISTHKINVDS